MLWQGWDYDGWRGFFRWGMMLAVLGLSLLVHEFAHILVARRCGIGTKQMIFLPVGAAALLEDFPRTINETWIAIAGPLASLALAGICQVGIFAMHCWMHGMPYRFLYHHPWLSTVMWLLRNGSMANLLMAAFNLLPCYPMDGGRVLRSLLGVTLRKFTQRTHATAFLLATKIAVRFVAWPLAIGAIIYTITTTRIWSHMVIFPLALAVGELEYWLLREKSQQPDREWAPRDGSDCLKLRLKVRI